MTAMNQINRKTEPSKPKPDKPKPDSIGAPIRIKSDDARRLSARQSALLDPGTGMVYIVNRRNGIIHSAHQTVENNHVTATKPPWDSWLAVRTPIGHYRFSPDVQVIDALGAIAKDYCRCPGCLARRTKARREMAAKAKVAARHARKQSSA